MAVGKFNSEFKSGTVFPKSFWERGYHEVRRELKGRYPKHYRPEDPHQAEPTRRVRPR